MNVSHALFTAGRIWIFASGHRPILLSGNRIFRQFAHVTAGNQIVERLRQLLFVGRVLIEQRTHLEEIVAQDGFARGQYRLLILRQARWRPE